MFQEDYERALNATFHDLTPNNYGGHCYDATWTLARELNGTLTGIGSWQTVGCNYNNMP
jgi:hypothetical protein